MSAAGQSPVAHTSRAQRAAGSVVSARRTLVVTPLLAAFALALAPAVKAQTASPWPTRVLRIVVPAPPGSTTDALARLLAEQLAPVLGQAVIVDNRAGAGGNIGTEFVARQPADGHTLLLTQNTIVTNVSFFKKLPYDPVKDFAPVSLIGTTPLLMAVNAVSTARSVKELIDLARIRNISYATAGVGTPHHLAAVLFSSTAGIEMTHVPYKGSSPAALALISGEVDMAISAVSAMLPHIQSGRIRPLGVTEARRTSLLPDVPTMGSVVPGFSLEAWYGVFFPAGTPRAIVEALRTEINRIMLDPAIAKARLAPLGVEAVGTTPERFLDIMKADIVKYEKVVKEANITPE